MGQYKDKIDTVPHNFNNSVATLDGDHKITGLEMLEVERDEDEVETQSVADGTAIFVENPIRTGTVTFQILESSPTTDYMWALREARAAFKFNFKDSSAPNLNCGGKYLRITKPPVVKRGKEADVVEWVCRATYLDVKGGSYKLETA